MTTRQRPTFKKAAFTLVELLTVMTIIGILAGLVLGTFKMVQDKAAKNRAEAEIKGMEAALESYKSDNGEYPNNSNTNSLNAAADTSLKPSSYTQQSLILYRTLSGDTNLDRQVDDTDGDKDVYGATVTPRGARPKTYFGFKLNQLLPAGGTGTVTSVIDPWGFSYGYSTANSANSSNGYNPTFDLWSTGGSTNDRNKWVKNW